MDQNWLPRTVCRPLLAVRGASPAVSRFRTLWLAYRSRWSPAGCINAAALALATIYGLVILQGVVRDGLYAWAGSDFRAYRAAAEVAHDYGYAKVYDLQLLGAFESHLVGFSEPGQFRTNFVTVDVPYLPAYLVLFQPLLLVDWTTGFAIWSALSLAAITAYLLVLKRSTGIHSSRSIGLAVVLSFPSLYSLRWGQVNPFLLIALGEFLRLGMRGADYRSGLWLGALLVKPQTLILFAPALVIAHRWRMLLGLLTMAVAVILVSLAVGGVEALASEAQLILSYSADGITAQPSIMPNWRGMAVRLATQIPPTIAWSVAITGMLLTAMCALSLWHRARRPHSRAFATMTLGTLAATCSVTWYSLIDTGLLLSAPLFYLAGRGRLPVRIAAAWILAPYLALFAAAIDLSLNPIAPFLANLLLVTWSALTFHRSAVPESTAMAHEVEWSTDVPLG